jgi:hypothetical protein
LALGLFAVLLAGTAALLWNAHRLDPALLWGGAAAIVGGLCAVGALCTGSPGTAGNPSER